MNKHRIANPSSHQCVDTLRSHFGISPVNLLHETQYESATNKKQFADIITQVKRKFKSSKLKDVKYLCHEMVRDRHVVENAKTVNVIFDDMVSYGTLGISTIGLLAELLHRCGLRKTMREIFHETGVSWQPDGPSYFSSFRCFLHGASRLISQEMLPDLKRYCTLRQILTPRDCDEIEDSLDLFSMLEEKDCIGPININLIKDFSSCIPKNKALMDCIDKYEKSSQLAVTWNRSLINPSTLLNLIVFDNFGISKEDMEKDNIGLQE